MKKFIKKKLPEERGSHFPQEKSPETQNLFVREAK